jgi:hypothetical protein
MRTSRLGAGAAAGTVALVAVLSACGGPTAAPSHTNGATTATAPDPNATESNPPGDIPDDQVFVRYSPPGASFSVKVPEGWARSAKGGAVTFTDKLNSISMRSVPATLAPTVDSARREELPRFSAGIPKFSLGDITTVRRVPGTAVLVTYQADSAPDPVTDKVVRDSVERYEFWHAGQEVVLTLSGPKGADNVDPWQIVTDSLTWTGR